MYIGFKLWNMERSLFGVHWVMLRSVVELLACWSNKFNRLRSKVLWRMISHCLMWVIWREINTRTFDKNERLIHELQLLFFQTWLIGQMLQLFLLLFLYLICLIFVLSLLLSFFFPMLLLAHGLCDFFPLYFFFFFQ